MLWLLVATVVTQAPEPADFDVSTLTLSMQTPVAELDIGKLQGDVRQLAWSDDAAHVYVMTTDRRDSSRHYVVTIAGGAIERVARQPQWAIDYWSYKSDRFAPGRASVQIAIQQMPAAAQKGSPLARFEPTTMSSNTIESGSQQPENVIRLLLYGETVGEFVDQDLVPGLTFGWGPKGTGAIAYTDGDGRLTLLDGLKRKRPIPGVKNATLPAWSIDGTKLAFLTKSGRRTYVLSVIGVSRRQPGDR